jgi:hypothetical protein
MHILDECKQEIENFLVKESPSSILVYCSYVKDISSQTFNIRKQVDNRIIRAALSIRYPEDLQIFKTYKFIDIHNVSILIKNRELCTSNTQDSDLSKKTMYNILCPFIIKSNSLDSMINIRLSSIGVNLI